MIAMRNEKRDHTFAHALDPRPRTQTELKRRNRALSFTDALIVVEWMNAAKGTAAYRRVLGIRAHLEHLSAMLETIRQQKPKSQSINDAEILLRLNLVIQRLSRYAFTPTLACDTSAGILRYSATPKAMRGLVVEVSDGSLSVQVSESTVVAALARLAANRELFKVHLCDECRKQWHAPQRKMDRFCSKECRILFRQTDEDSRERHARAQARYRKSPASLEGYASPNERK